MKRTMLLAGLFVLAGCMGAQHYNAKADEDLTVGTVQKEIRVGMSGASVAEVLGSPNIVSTDEERNEVWIYDKISTQYVSADASAGILALGGKFAMLGRADASSRQSSGASSQRTLTVVIKFDENKLVRDFSYHTSKF